MTGLDVTHSLGRTLLCKAALSEISPLCNIIFIRRGSDYHARDGTRNRELCQGLFNTLSVAHDMSG